MNWTVLSLLLLIGFSSAGKIVKKLKDDNFEEAIATNPAILVRFMASGCSNCDALKPVFKQVSALLKDKNLNCTLASINADSQVRTSQKYRIQGFPTVMLFLNGTATTYKGDRDAVSIVKFIAKMTGPASTELDADTLVALMDTTGLRSVLATDDKKAVEKYEEIARKVYEYDFYHMAVKKAGEVFSNIAHNQVIVLKDFDEGTVILTEDFTKTKTALRDFLNTHMFPTVNDIADNATVKPLEKVLSKGQRKGIFLFRSKDDPKSEEYDREFRSVATEMKGPSVLFFSGDVKDPVEKQIAEILGVAEEDLPLVQAVEFKKDTMMFRHNGDINSDSIKNFMTKWKEGAVPRYYTSEPIPKENSGPVIKVVGKTFKDEVINNNKHVLVRYYAPWCEFSAMMEPIFKRIADSLSDNTQIKFCEMDVTKNDVEGYPAEGYPILKYFPADKKNDPSYYDDDFTEDAMTKFVEKILNVPVRLTDESLRNYVADGKIKPDL